MDDDGFINLVGPLWRRMNGASPEYAIVGQDKHRNRRGVVQGGLLMTLADRTCGMTARFVSGTENTATVQMDTQFVDAARIGDIMISRPRVVRDTKSLIFMSTEMTATGRCVAPPGRVQAGRSGADPVPAARQAARKAHSVCPPAQIPGHQSRPGCLVLRHSHQPLGPDTRNRCGFKVCSRTIFAKPPVSKGSRRVAAPIKV